MNALETRVSWIKWAYGYSSKLKHLWNHKATYKRVNQNQKISLSDAIDLQIQMYKPNILANPHSIVKKQIQFLLIYAKPANQCGKAHWSWLTVGKGRKCELEITTSNDSYVHDSLFPMPFFEYQMQIWFHHIHSIIVCAGCDSQSLYLAICMNKNE